MAYGERISELRTKMKLTQDDLAKRLGITRAALSHYEKDRREPDYETLERIADFFDVQVDYLLGRTNDPSPSVKKEKPVNRAFLELPEDVSEEEKEFLQAQLDLQLEIFRKLKEKNSKQ
ncbi:helix-turn-helix transcriptional regulator [Brevibacillus sp. FSL L8-0520]|uniref:helix-turn-helix domain-containing protein n=1 Tax=Brevibacillus sp. FSL L8-0520 TaxID=2954689 RepID=UPI0030CAD03C